MEQSESIIARYPRVTKLRGKKVVIKFGGSSIEASGELERFARDMALLVSVGVKPIIVHGGGPEITEEMRRRHLPVKKVLGLRITDDATLEVAKSVLARINDQIVRALEKVGLKAIGLAGTECNSIVCRKMPPKRGKDENGIDIEVDLGWVGDPVRADPKTINLLVMSGFVPVIYPICGDEDGQIMNVNADTAACFVAKAVKAEDFVLVTDVPGLMRVFGDPSTVIPEIKVSEFQTLVSEGIVKEGMIPKLEACVVAVRDGVKTAHMIDGKNPDAIIGQLLTGRNYGTRIVP
jgi:acetylglutamate kinase